MMRGARICSERSTRCDGKSVGPKLNLALPETAHRTQLAAVQLGHQPRMCLRTTSKTRDVS